MEEREWECITYVNNKITRLYMNIPGYNVQFTLRYGNKE
jgi:hypothetical protein